MDEQILKLIDDGKKIVEAARQAEQDNWDKEFFDYVSKLDRVFNQINVIIPVYIIPYIKLNIEKPPEHIDWEWMNNHRNTIPPMQTSVSISIDGLSEFTMFVAYNSYSIVYEPTGFRVWNELNGFVYPKTIEEALYYAKIAYEDAHCEETKDD